MKVILAFFTSISLLQAQPDSETIISRVDNNMTSDNRISTSKMIVRGKRGERIITSKSWSIGTEKAMTEYLSPPREEGTKMLKLDDELYIYSPNTDRIIKMSGHMLRQSVMGSDLSYEDMMEDRKLLDAYDATLAGEETLDGRKVYVLELNAKVNDVAYARRKMWIDAKRFVPLKEQLYAKSGKLLKKTNMKDVTKINNRWYPKTIVYKDMLKDGNGTVFKITDIQFNEEIPQHRFTKAALKK